jgi:hypothetical protein
MYGRVCFKCHGTGQQFTKRGRAAAAWLKELRTIKAGDVKVGMRIKVPSVGTFNVKIAELETKSSGKSLQNGVWIDMPPHFHLKGEKLGIYTFSDADVELVLSKEERAAQFQRAIDFQNSLTKEGKPRKMKEIKS